MTSQTDRASSHDFARRSHTEALTEARFARLRPIPESSPCEQLARWAAASLVGEARLTPKPGLVDRRNTGAHRDMDLDTFLASATALEPRFCAYANAGLRLGGDNPSALATELRRLGVTGEQAMFSATNGINTHKGANFAFTLIMGACGAHLAQTGKLPSSVEDTARVLSLVQAMGACLLDADVRDLLARSHLAAVDSASSTALSHGEQIYLKCGLSGARGEAAQGYPLLRNLLLPYLREHCPTRIEHAATSEPDASSLLLQSLLILMAHLEDTNVVHRGGIEALADHRAFCENLLAQDLSDQELRRALERYDDRLISTNISPGGAADLLSLGIFFALTEGLFTLGALRYAV